MIEFTEQTRKFFDEHFAIEINMLRAANKPWLAFLLSREDHIKISRTTEGDRIDYKFDNGYKFSELKIVKYKQYNEWFYLYLTIVNNVIEVTPPISNMFQAHGDFTYSVTINGDKYVKQAEVTGDCNELQ